VTAPYGYIDSSALIKLVVEERESRALEADIIQRAALFCSTLGATELHRASRRALTRRQLGRIDDVLEAVFLVDVTPAILMTAGTLAPAEIRTLDAIHVATALSLNEHELDVITYDVRMSRAAKAHGFRVVAP
jgi:predicted nucleic acid-binding protein